MSRMRLLPIVAIMLLVCGFFASEMRCSSEPAVVDSAEINVETCIEANMDADRDNDSSYKGLVFKTDVLPMFTRYSHDSTADFGCSVSYSIAVDFPKSSVMDAGYIRKWLIGLIESSPTYKGDIYNNRLITRFASIIYLAKIKGAYGTDSLEYPFSMFSILNLQARVYNERFITYYKFTHDYEGGAHGYYTERLVSFDHVHQQKMDCHYLFKPECMDKILDILIEEAKKTPQYKEWKPNIREFITDNEFPDPGLAEDGMVFSFQPYDISCFAAGTFHFTVPYAKLLPYMTERAKWCLKLK